MQLNLVDRPEIPIYRRIADAVHAALESGELIPGAKLPAQMTLARQLGINPLTVSRGYELLESQGVVQQRRGSGTYVNPDALRCSRAPAAGRIQSVTIIVGESSLSHCPRETLFIVTDIRDGINDVFGARQVHVNYAENFSPESLGPLTPADAVLVFHTRQRDASNMLELLQRGIPVLSIWEAGLTTIAPSVDYDRQQAAALACRHLVACGHRRIGFIGRKMYRALPVSAKFGAFTSVMHESGRDILARDIRDVERAPGRAYAAARDLIASGDLADAFFVDTDYKAMEVIAAFGDAGLRVPEDVAIVSYDDVPEAATFHPALTSVRVPRRQVGQRAAQLLMNWSPQQLPASVTLQSQLIVRASCGSTVPQAVTQEAEQ